MRIYFVIPWSLTYCPKSSVAELNTKYFINVHMYVSVMYVCMCVWSDKTINVLNLFNDNSLHVFLYVLCSWLL